MPVVTSRSFFAAAYAAIVLLGTMDAAIWKADVDTPSELAWVIVSTGVALVAAHWYAEVLAKRIAQGRALDAADYGEAFTEMIGSLVVAAVTCVPVVVAAAERWSFNVAAAGAHVVLVGVLAIAGAIGARLSGASTGRTVVAAGIAVVVGVVLAGLKYWLGP